MTEEEKLAYLAGIIDGEGTISINGHKGGKKGVMYYVLFIKVTNTDKPLINWLHEEFGGGAFRINRNGWNPKWKIAYNWDIEGTKAFKLLKQVNDKLIVKKEQAALGIEFYSRCQRTTWAGGRPRPLWVVKASGEYHQKMLALNKKGRELTEPHVL